MKPGDQIAYIPSHVTYSHHEGIEFGFVEEDNEGASVLCRYWREAALGTLRTRANGERTPRGRLIKVVSVPQDLVDFHLQGIQKEKENG